MHTLCLIGRICVYILPSVRTHLVSQSQREILEKDVEQWMRSMPLYQLFQFHDLLSDSVSVSLLQLRYAFMVSAEVGTKLHYGAQFWNLLIDAVSPSEETSPDLKVECFRLLLLRLAQDPTFTPDFIDPLIKYISQNIHWSPSTTTDTSRESALALLHILLDRHLSTIETSALSVQIDQLVALILSIATSLSTGNSKGRTPQNIVLETLHSAVFWELPRLRGTWYLFVYESFLFKSLTSNRFSTIWPCVTTHRFGATSG
jgi:hypothetical protein